MTENWERARSPIFAMHRGDDGVERLTVDRFYPVIRVSGDLLSKADPHVVKHDRADGTIRFACANGSAVYRIVATNPVLNEHLCELEYSSDRTRSGPS